jgi:hypothetical protein
MILSLSRRPDVQSSCRSICTISASFHCRKVTLQHSTTFLSETILQPSHWSIAERVVSFFLRLIFLCFGLQGRQNKDLVAFPTISQRLRIKTVSFVSSCRLVLACTVVMCGRIVSESHRSDGALFRLFFVVPVDPPTFAYGTISPRHRQSSRFAFVLYLSRLDHCLTGRWIVSLVSRDGIRCFVDWVVLDR